ncbi:MAG: OmpA family protein, partial [Muribaculaceae bacterium]|nr:OmpA family protein [Muribaculaceae bacterium]
TSSEGDSLRNLQLSEQRANAAVSFLVDKEGIDASRLSPVGMGSSVPVDPENPEANRRTQFEILN